VAVSENDVDRELLNRIAEAYFSRKRRQATAAPKDGASDKKEDERSDRGDRPKERTAPQHRRHWHGALGFTPLVIL